MSKREDDGSHLLIRDLLPHIKMLAIRLVSEPTLPEELLP
jgi:hypothetical protein